MQYFEAPAEYSGNGPGTSLFIAGGITGCPDWQAELAKHLRSEDVVILNPRRAASFVRGKSLDRQQIVWEHDHLRKATAVSFWFSSETLCPITLYELGSWSMSGKKIFVGVHPDYKRRQDVEIQTSLVRPEVKLVYDIPALAGQIRDWLKERAQDTPLRR